jgi:hypothetical protein
MPTGFALAYECNDCGAISEAFVVDADQKQIETMIHRAWDNAKCKMWPSEDNPDRADEG